MRILDSFDPASAPNGYMDIGAADPGSKVLFYNLSVVNILLNFDNGNTDILHAGEAKWWTLDGTTATLAWEQYSVLQATAAISEVSGALYGPDETIQGTYPTSLIHQVNVANPNGVNTNVSSTNSIDNEGNPNGTQIIRAVPQGASAPTVTLDNNGNLMLDGSLIMSGVAQIQLSNNVPLQALDNTGTPRTLTSMSTQNHVIFGSGGAQWQFRNTTGGTELSYDPSTHQMLFNNGAWSLIGPSGLVIFSTSSANTYINATNSDNLQVNGSTIFQANSGGVSVWGAQTMVNNSIRFNLAGSINGWTFVTGVGSGTVTHGLGAQPHIVLPVCTAVNSSMAVGYDSATTTTVHINALSGVSWIAICIAI
jgi:hypothetical protein